MDTAGINLMSYVKTETTPPEVSAPTAFDNPAYEDSPGKEDQKDGQAKQLDDVTAQNTVVNGSRPGAKIVKTADDSTSDEKTTTTATDGKSTGTFMVPPSSNRQKDSAVGFVLPEDQNEHRKSQVPGLRDMVQPFRGMGKEVLLYHSSKPFWRRLRYLCMTVIMVGWLALIIAVVAIVLIYPRCRTPPAQNWWRKAVVYRIYVRSFLDSDGDGIGDFEGIQSRLGYLKDMGVTIISLSPIYPIAENSDNEMDIVDHKAISPEYGTFNQFISLVNASHAIGINIILDFIPNHTSRSHPWFVESQNSSDYSNFWRNYYVWEDGPLHNRSEIPNNWKSVYNGSAWAKGFPRGQYCLHQFSPDQADLNLRSSEVKDSLLEILEYWLSLDVDGFYIRDSGYLFEDYDMRNDQLLSVGLDENLYESYDHTFTYGQSEIHDMFARWRALMDHYGNKTGQYRLLFADRRGDISDIIEYYGQFNRDGVHFPLNTFSLEMDNTTDGKKVSQFVRQWMNNLPANRWPNWLGGSDTSRRMMDRLGEKVSRLYLTLIMLMPGTPVVYYGDEIGMRGSPYVNSSESLFGQRRRNMRSPMSWDNSTDAGFCSCSIGRPWIPPNPQYKTTNVKNQQGTSGSLLLLFTNLTSLRATYNSFHYGDYNEAVVDDAVFSFVRDFDGEKGFLVALNFANYSVTRNYYGTYHTIPKEAKVAMRTGIDVPYLRGDKLSCSGLSLGAHQGVVLTWDYVAKEL